MRTFGSFSFASFLFIAACATGNSGVGEPAMPGADRDVNGCIPSAGYSWCARTNQCERPWELAEKHGFARTDEAFNEYCLGQPPVE